MRRVVASLLTLVVVGATVTALSAPAGAERHHAPTARAAEEARSALARVAEHRHGEVTMALADLFRTRASLSGDERRRADALLARPTDGASDPYGDGYTVQALVKCSSRVCVHWVPSTQDAPPSASWVDTTLTTMNNVWTFEVGKLGYHPPIPDGHKGGDKRFDVYLADVGSKGYYGYCAPEDYAPGDHDLASGFCVLDNDFSKQQFGAPPMLSLKVTAAHEFFHAIQYAYDVNEDRWFMEATATWMEERYADDANDNRQYLPHGQLGVPSTPLDKFDSSGAQYGNWIFFELLSQQFGRDVVRSIWRQAAGFAGAPNQYSMAAVRTVIANRGSRLPTMYAAFAGGNTIPAETYSEGSAYQAAPIARSVTLSAAAPATGSQTTTLEHLTSRTISLTPDAALIDPSWQVSLTFDLPDTARGSGAFVVVKRSDGTVLKSVVTLDAHGKATLTRPFSVASVTAVTLTLANGSSRYTCWRGKPWACHGVPLDNGLSYTWSATLVPPPA